MNANFLKINSDKTEILLFYPPSLSSEIIIKGTFIDGQCIRFSNDVKNVGVWLDKHLNLEKHINKIVSHCHKLLKDIGRVRNMLTNKHTEMLVHAVTSSRLDYCNSIFFNMNKNNVYKLQKVQNAAARLVMKKRKRESVRTVLNELHWLPVESRILFKILLLVHKVVKGKCSKNLKVSYKRHNCRPDDFLMLEVKNARTKFGKRTFDYAAPRLWNALSKDMRKEDDVEEFKKNVKTLLFSDTRGFLRKAFCYN